MVEKGAEEEEMHTAVCWLLGNLKKDALVDLFSENQGRLMLFFAAVAFLLITGSCSSKRPLASDAGNDSSECTSNYDCERSAHCVDSRCLHDPGTSDGPCYGNGTCNPGLRCDDGRCIEPVTGSRDGPCYGNGTCDAPLSCEDGVCAAEPGTNGGRCIDGSCRMGLECQADRCLPVCIPKCSPSQCGLDEACGEPCGTCPDPNSACERGRCVCRATCAERGSECGEVCGRSCGDCMANQECSRGTCRCLYESCGAGICCNASETCFAGACCQPNCTGRVCGPDDCGRWCRPDACRAPEFCHNGACEPLDEFCGERIHYTSVVDEILLRSDPRVTCDDPACTDPFIEACPPDRMLQCTHFATWWVRDVAIDPDAATIIVEIIPSTYSHGTGMVLRFDSYFERDLNVEIACIWNEIARFEPADLPPGSRLSNPTTLSVHCRGGVGFTRLRVTSIACRDW